MFYKCSFRKNRIKKIKCLSDQYINCNVNIVNRDYDNKMLSVFILDIIYGYVLYVLYILTCLQIYRRKKMYKLVNL